LAYKVDILFDVSCGDQQWAPVLRSLVPNLKYIGVDVVPAVVEYDRQTFAKEDHVEFFLLDMTEPNYFEKISKRSKILQDKNIESKVVLLLCRHTLFHLKNQHISLILQNFKNTKILDYIAISNQPTNLNKRENFETGGWLPVNLEREPFNLFPPILSWKEANFYGEYKSFINPEYDFGSSEIAIWGTGFIPVA